MDPPNISLQPYLLSTSTKTTISKSENLAVIRTSSSPTKSPALINPNPKMISKFVHSISNALFKKNFVIFIICWSMIISTGYCGILKPSCRVVGHEELIDVAGCDLVVVKVNKCKGYCTSFSFFHPLNNEKLTMHAKCCRMTEVKHVEVAVSCSDGEKTVKIPSAVECNCYDCGAENI
uniref:CTCK domain-containing protein n=1 Tax=Panagrolaimus sp. PS1159 TaxID=55785 RepID=A0AC35F6K0_9BILA